MPPTNPRIIVVDDNQGLYNIVRASLELLGRRPRLIETHTPEDALTELRISSPDLLVTAQTLPGQTDGPTLATLAKRELAALPVIVLGAERDAEISEEELAQSPFQYLRRPFAPESFLRAVRVALDGPEAVPQAAQPEDIYGPVPAIDSDKLRPILFRLMREAGAMAVVMADRNGKVITYEGAAGYVDRDLLASALGPGFGSTAKILPIIGDQPRVLKYYDGDKIDLFGLAVGLHHFITLIFETNAGDRAMGTVKRLGAIAVNEMLGIVGEVAFSVRPIAATPAAAPAKLVEHAPRRGRRTQEMAALQAAPTRTPAPAPARAAAPPKAEKPVAEPIPNFDPNLFDSLDSLDMSKADDLFDPEKLAASVPRSSGNKISFDDALLQGIIGNVDE